MNDAMLLSSRQSHKGSERMFAGDLAMFGGESETTRPVKAPKVLAFSRDKESATARQSNIEIFKPLSIALISPLYEAVPPQLYGGTERVVAHLADALVDLGHDVTLFASSDSKTKAKLIGVRDQGIRLDANPLTSGLAAHLSQLDEVRNLADRFDVLHFHLDLLHFPFFTDIASRTLTTLHGRLDLKDLPDAYLRWPEFPLASISDSQRTPLKLANWVGTVHHGVPDTLYRFTAAPRGGYLAFLGRISPEKRPDIAIAISKMAGIPLKIAAKIDAADRGYFENTIRPLLNHPLIEFVGEIGDAAKSDFLGNALALLFPIDWPEPFGLVMIEAMACGTPVIAFDKGSVREVVDEGVTGHIVDSLEEAVEAVRTITNLQRERVRDRFEQRFSSATMARSYLMLYRRLLRSTPKPIYHRRTG
jgi:glycosyltransferase involved in cell wall biosynthesis